MERRTWTPEDTQRLRTEMERRYAERTPPKRVDELLEDYRVGRGEMRAWLSDQGLPPMPETDIEWMTAQAAWYRRMARRVNRAKGWNPRPRREESGL